MTLPPHTAGARIAAGARIPSRTPPLKNPPAKSRAIVWALSACVLGLVSGCPPQSGPAADPSFFEMNEAIAIVESHTSGIDFGIQAKGSVHGRFKDPDGRIRRFDLDGNLQFLAPRNLRFNLSALGNSEVLLGSNDEYYWLAIMPETDTYWHGRHDQAHLHDPADIPLHPEQMIAALGLVHIPCNTDDTDVPVYRVVDDFHQLIFITQRHQGRSTIEKEYWLDRYPPHLIRRVQFRDQLGRVFMNAYLDDYRSIDGADSIMPYRFRIDWPIDESSIDFRVHRWRQRRRYTPDGPYFIPPHQRGVRYRRVIDLDAKIIAQSIHLQPPAKDISNVQPSHTELDRTDRH